MMTEELKRKLLDWADTYQVASFIETDPVQFPHRFTRKQDIEISGLLTALMSFGNRKQILQKVEKLHELMGASPYAYVRSGKWRIDFAEDDHRSFYRMLSYVGMRRYFDVLYNVYSSFESMEDALLAQSGCNPFERLCNLLEVSSKSPQKKLNMFLRWMIRRDSPVDFGLWYRFSPADLLIPLDTHVCRVAYMLHLTDSSAFTLKNVRIITVSLSEVFPGDPCKGDFALFGYGVTHK